MKLLSNNEVAEIIGRSRTTLNRWWRSGAFPKPIMHNGRALGWYEKDVLLWFKNK